MNPFIETLNHWGGLFLAFAWPVLWQSSLLIVLVLAVDFLFRDRMRASLRYALWLVVLVKLCLPPTLALPTSPAWWLHKTQTAAAQPTQIKYTISYNNTLPSEALTNPLPAFVPPKPTMTIAAWSLVISMATSAALFGWLTVRWWQIARKVRGGSPSERLTAISAEAQKTLGVRRPVPVRMKANSMSPAVCGLFHPTILIPESLANNFSDEQLRAVLLHELIHVRRFDVWVNFWQALLQIAYWWHPLVWVANARIRRVREEAVDDAVMLTLRDDAESYAPTLLEVAKLSLNRPLTSLGLVGILESRHSLRQRIERLLDFRPPRNTGLTLASFAGILAFSAIAVPMGNAPANKETASNPSQATPSASVQQTNSPAFVTNSLQIITNNTGIWSFEKLPPAAQAASDSPSVKGIMTDPNFRAVLHTLERRTGSETLTEPEVTTISVQGQNRVNTAPASDTFDIFGAGPEREESKEALSQCVSTNESGGKLFNRVFRVDPNTLHDNFGKGSDSASNGVTAIIKGIAGRAGVNLDSPADRLIFYNVRSGLLFVKAPQLDLDKIERVVQDLGKISPHVHIKARFIEVPIETAKAFEPSLKMTNGSEKNLYGILSGQEAKTVLLSLDPKQEKTLAEPEITTLSDRQTQMRCTTIINIITNFTFDGTETNGSLIPQTTQVETGPVIDVVPNVLADGYAVNLRTAASVTDFLGYDRATNTIDVYTETGGKTGLPIVLPRFTIRESKATANLWDGQTLVLEKFENPRYSSANLPHELIWGGTNRMFLSEPTATATPDKNRQLLVFVTVDLVDPAGNKIHSAGDMPFAQNAIPLQQPPQ